MGSCCSSCLKRILSSAQAGRGGGSYSRTDGDCGCCEWILRRGQGAVNEYSDGRSHQDPFFRKMAQDLSLLLSVLSWIEWRIWILLGNTQAANNVGSWVSMEDEDDKDGEDGVVEDRKSLLIRYTWCICLESGRFLEEKGAVGGYRSSRSSGTFESTAR
jgi:hypothetical protein